MVEIGKDLSGDDLVQLHCKKNQFNKLASALTKNCSVVPQHLSKHLWNNLAFLVLVNTERRCTSDSYIIVQNTQEQLTLEQSTFLWK